MFLKFGEYFPILSRLEENAADRALRAWLLGHRGPSRKPSPSRKRILSMKMKFDERQHYAVREGEATPPHCVVAGCNAPIVSETNTSVIAVLAGFISCSKQAFCCRWGIYRRHRALYAFQAVFLEDLGAMDPNMRTCGRVLTELPAMRR